MVNFRNMIQLMHDLVNWEHQTMMSLQHGDDAKLVTGNQDLRASVNLWRSCIDILDLLKVSQTGAATGEVSARSGRASEVDGAEIGRIQLKTAGEVMEVIFVASLASVAGLTAVAAVASVVAGVSLECSLVSVFLSMFC